MLKNPEFNPGWFSKEEPLIILCCENMPIDIFSEILEEYEIVYINYKNENPIDIIKTTRNKAINNNKKAVIVLLVSYFND